MLLLLLLCWDSIEAANNIKPRQRLELHGNVASDERGAILLAKGNRIANCSSLAKTGYTLGENSHVISFNVVKQEAVDDVTEVPQLVQGRPSPESLRQQLGRAGRCSLSHRRVRRHYFFRPPVALRVNLASHGDLSSIAGSELLY